MSHGAAAMTKLVITSEEFVLKIKAQEWVKHLDTGLDFFQGNSGANVPLPSQSLVREALLHGGNTNSNHSGQ
jgi:hypothetical protein